MEHNRTHQLKFQFVVLKLYSSIYKRIDSWGLFLLLALLYSSSVGLQSPVLLKLFGRLGLMSIHVLSGFGLILAFIIIAYDYLQKKFLGRPSLGFSLTTLKTPVNYDQSGYRQLVNLLFYAMLMIVCILGFFYYFTKELSLDGLFFHLQSISLLHAIAGWFFLSLIFVRYYLTVIQSFREFYRYLRE